MDSVTLNRLSEHFSNCFIGVFPCDCLPNNVPRPSCLIANTQPKGSKGEHWVSIFINKEGYGDYFCSYGVPPVTVFTAFMNRECQDWNFSVKRIQSDLSTTCGQYALFFIFCRTHGLPMHKFLSLFTKNVAENDAIITAFINGKFNISTKIYDSSLFQ